MSKELREEFTKVKGEALELIGTAKKENRDLTGEEAEANAKRFARCETIKKQLDEESKFASLAVSELPEEVLNFAKGNHENKAKQEFESSKGDRLTADRHKDVVNQFIRSGSVPHELFSIVAGSGGVTLPAANPVVIKRQINPFKAALQAYNYEILNVAGFGNVPIFNDSANVADVIAQDSTSENSKDPAITNLTGDVLYDSGSTWFSNTYLSQANFDPLSYFRPMLDARIEASQTSAWSAALLAAASVGVTGASTTGITYAELVALKYSLPVSGRQDGVFLLSSGLMQAVENMVDTTGRPLYRDSLSENTPDRLLGWPVFVVSDLVTPAANAKTAIVASASALVAREFGPRRLVRYENIPTRPDQVGIREFANGGFGIFASHVKVFKQAAS